MPVPIKFYSDENVSKAVVKGLKARGIDILTCQEAGMLKASDAEHLHFASQSGRVVFTHDTDFYDCMHKV